MGAYFLDTSALAKRYMIESGHIWVRSLCHGRASNSIYVAQVAQVEVIAALCRAQRERPPRLSIARRDRLIASFRRHLRQYNVVSLTPQVLTRAANLCRVHPLREYDAVQLASALQARDDALAIDVPPPTFVCADTVLLGVAAAEGLAAENPSAHP